MYAYMYIMFTCVRVEPQALLCKAMIQWFSDVVLGENVQLDDSQSSLKEH